MREVVSQNGLERTYERQRGVISFACTNYNTGLCNINYIPFFRGAIMFKIYEDHKEDRQIYLRLFYEYGEIVLAAVDSSGCKIPSGNILLITNDGLLQRRHQVSSGIGLKLDYGGRICMGSLG